MSSKETKIKHSAYKDNSEIKDSITRRLPEYGTKFTYFKGSDCLCFLI